MNRRTQMAPDRHSQFPCCRLCWSAVLLAAMWIGSGDCAWGQESSSTSAEVDPLTPTAAQLSDALLPMIAQHQGKVAVAVKHADSELSFEYRADEVMPTASLIKLPLMVATYHRAAQGEVDFDRQIVLGEEDRVPGSGVLTEHFSPGTVIHLRDAVRLMMVFSDNTATNLVVDQVGLPATAELMEQLGLEETKLHSKVYRRDTSIYPERSSQFGLGSTTAAEMLRLLEMLSDHELVAEEASRAMAEHLYACEDDSMLARFLPELKIAHKSGAISDSRCDAGWMDTPAGRILICVLTTENSDQSWGKANAAELLCGRLAKAAYDVFNAQQSAVASSLTAAAGEPLSRGSQGILVEGLQRTLNARAVPSPELSVDGDFGPATEAAVKAFQRSKQLPATGSVGPETWALLGPIVDQAEGPEEIDPQRNPADSIIGPPIVSCEAWAVCDAESSEILWSYGGQQPRHPASTTKIMTALLACRLLEKHPELSEEQVTFSSVADQTIGSSCLIRAGEKLALGDLLRGLLLPSGNDAAVAIAEHLGDRLANPQSNEPDSDSSLLAGVDQSSYERFISAMNWAARDMNLTSTHFENPHGLTEAEHQTSAKDLCWLTAQALRSELFREIIGTRSYTCEVAGPSGYQRRQRWKNTNRLLGIEGFVGAKTGTTQAAGACLVGVGQRDGRELIVVVMGASSSDNRYLDARNLFQWSWRQLHEKAAKEND